MGEEITPPLDVQYEEILTFVVDLCHKNEDMFYDNPVSPPKCEQGSGAAKYGAIVYNKDTGMPVGRTHKDSWGNPQPNSRECPNCGHLHFDNCAMNTVLTCPQCGTEYCWQGYILWGDLTGRRERWYGG